MHKPLHLYRSDYAMRGVIVTVSYLKKLWQKANVIKSTNTLLITSTIRLVISNGRPNGKNGLEENCVFKVENFIKIKFKLILIFYSFNISLTAKTKPYTLYASGHVLKQ